MRVDVIRIWLSIDQDAAVQRTFFHCSDHFVACFDFPIR